MSAVGYVGDNLPPLFILSFCLVWSLYFGLPFHFLVLRLPSFGNMVARSRFAQLFYHRD